MLSVLALLCALGLVWVFATGREQTMIAFALYPLSFYTLSAFCVKLPAGIRRCRRWLARQSGLSRVLGNRETRFAAALYLDQVINFAYGIFKIVSGVVVGSAWIGCDGIYNLAQALVQLFLILRRRHMGTMEKQWRSYRLCGSLILLMHLSLTGIVFQMVNWNRAAELGQILVISTAVFAFYKIIKSFIRIARDRKHAHPVDSSIRMLNLAQSIFAMFSLQASMFHTFGTGDLWESRMNLSTGCVVCLLIVCIGIYMIRRGSREIKALQEKENGEQRL